MKTRRRTFLERTVGGLAGAVLGGCGTALPTGTEPLSVPSPSPAPLRREDMLDIVFIQADDLDAMSIERGIRGEIQDGDVRFMPNLSHLAQDGTVFTNSYVASALCGPSRAALLTGKYPHTTRIIGNGDDGSKDGGFPGLMEYGDGRTLATFLHDIGYQTLMVGKYINNYHLGDGHRPPGWSRWFAVSTTGAYQDYYVVRDDGASEFFGQGPENYTTDVLGQRAVSLLDETISQHPTDPFFLFLNFVAPHKPARPPARYGGLFRREVPMVHTWNEDIRDKPDFLRNDPPLDSATWEEITRLYVKRLQCMQGVDDWIGRIVQFLVQRNRINRTMVIFTSDNGWLEGQHRMPLIKKVAYEESVRVPTVIRGPGLQRGWSNQFISNVDYIPTFLDMAGHPVPEDLEGRSFKPLFNPSGTGADQLRVDVFTEMLNEEDIPPYRELRTRDWAIIEYGGEELEAYDMRVDPYQQDNLGRLSPDRIPRELIDRLHRLSTCSGRQCW